MSDQRSAYIHGHHDSVLRSHRWRTIHNSAAYLIPRLRPGQQVLDVGCGPGTITVELARMVAPGNVVGIDNEPVPLEPARADAQRQGVSNVSFTMGDVYQLNYPDRTFDRGTRPSGSEHLTEPVAALREMRRMCKPDGYVAARDADFSAMAWYPPEDRLVRWLALYRRVAYSNRTEPDAGRRLLSWARAAGFEEIACSATAWCFATPGERAWWGGLRAERVTSSALAGQALDRHLATRDDLEDIADGWRRWAKQHDGWFTVLNGEVLCRG